MYVIVHKISMGTAATKSAAAAYIPDSAPGIKIANLEAIGSVNADIAGVAGVMTMMIPVLAGMLTKGAMAVGSQGEALLSQFRSGAEAAGAAATTGNFSFGNTAFENASWNNRSANRWVTSGEMDQGNFRTTDGNLNRTEYGANGARTLTSSMSNTAWNARFSEGVSSALVEAAGTGDDFAQVMYAAQNSTDEATFWAMMHCVLVAQQQLAIRATNEDRLAGGRLLPQALAVPRTRATDQVISHEPIYDEPHRLAI